MQYTYNSRELNSAHLILNIAYLLK